MKISEKIYIFFLTTPSIKLKRKAGKARGREEGKEGVSYFRNLPLFCGPQPQNYTGDIIDNFRLKYFLP